MQPGVSRFGRTQLRPNHYPDGPYKESPCVWCRAMLTWTGATSGVTWVPSWIVRDLPRHEHIPLGSTCWQNEVERGGYAGHEPWEAVPIQTPVEDGICPDCGAEMDYDDTCPEC